MTLYVLSGQFKGFKLFAPKRKETRPATSLLRGMVFNSCQSMIEGARVLDLFAGSGAMGIEALSRGASFVTFNDLSSECTQVIEQNLQKIDKKKSGEVFQMDAFHFLEKCNNTLPYDLILLHPPYPIGKEGYLRLIDLMIRRKDLLAPEGRIFLEVPGPLEKVLVPAIEEGFTLVKAKSRSTWALLTLEHK